MQTCGSGQQALGNSTQIMRQEWHSKFWCPFVVRSIPSRRLRLAELVGRAYFSAGGITSHCSGFGLQVPSGHVMPEQQMQTSS